MNEKYFDISGVYENYTLNGDAVVNADNVTLKNLTINGRISVRGSNACILGCTVTADDNAIVSCAKDFIAKNNKINCSKNAILLQSGSQNALF